MGLGVRRDACEAAGGWGGQGADGAPGPGQVPLRHRALEARFPRRRRAPGTPTDSCRGPGGPGRASSLGAACLGRVFSGPPTLASVSPRPAAVPPGCAPAAPGPVPRTRCHPSATKGRCGARPTRSPSARPPCDPVSAGTRSPEPAGSARNLDPARRRQKARPTFPGALRPSRRESWGATPRGGVGGSPWGRGRSGKGAGPAACGAGPAGLGRGHAGPPDAADSRRRGAPGARGHPRRGAHPSAPDPREPQGPPPAHAELRPLQLRPCAPRPLAPPQRTPHGIPAAARLARGPGARLAPRRAGCGAWGLGLRPALLLGHGEVLQHGLRAPAGWAPGGRTAGEAALRGSSQPGAPDLTAGNPPLGEAVLWPKGALLTVRRVSDRCDRDLAEGVDPGPPPFLPKVHGVGTPALPPEDVPQSPAATDTQGRWSGGLSPDSGENAGLSHCLHCVVTMC